LGKLWLNFKWLGVPQIGNRFSKMGKISEMGHGKSRGYGWHGICCKIYMIEREPAMGGQNQNKEVKT
jgi:hypothetical protein